MRTLVVGHCDGAHSMLEVFKRALPLAVSSDTQVVFQQDPPGTPDLLIYSVFGNKHRSYNCRKILMCGEPSDLSRQRPDLLIDCKNVPRFRGSGPFAYLPFYVTSFVERFQNKPTDLVKPPTYNPAAILASKTKFCAFLYSQNVDFRNSLFDVVSRYKPVDALGKARGPPNRPVDRQVYEVGRRTYNDLAVQKYRPYKFVICCENSRHPGYVTEKMISAMLANAIPIYLGAPDVVDHFNPASFINVGAFPNWEHAVARIRELDQDDAKYKAVLAEPWLKGNVLNGFFDKNLLVGALRGVLSLPKTAQANPVSRNRSGPRLGTLAARNLRTAAHHRVGNIRAVRPPAPKMGTLAHTALRQRVTRPRPTGRPKSAAATRIIRRA